ncbi:MAG: hypothetical protein JRN48_00325 [Nitrososphaerota archaeon]|nr:hypothetical protein [Nitrososphaerota archaeon]
MTQGAGEATADEADRPGGPMRALTAARGARRGIGASGVVAVELLVLAVAGVAAAIYESGVETYWCGVQQPMINGVLVLACAIIQGVEGTFIFLGVGGVLAAIVAWIMGKLLTAT